MSSTTSNTFRCVLLDVIAYSHSGRLEQIFVNRVEGQLTGADSFEIRTVVDTSYEKIVSAMFESLQQMAKLEGEGEDKGQLNYHVILIGNWRPRYR